MDDGQVEGYGTDITALIPQDDIAAYQRAADAINTSGAQILWIQHEFGIFGGESGSHLLTLLNRISIPVAVTLHTLLESPNGAQRAVLDTLLKRAGAIIVMERSLTPRESNGQRQRPWCSQSAALLLV